MKAKELIEILALYPEDMPVMIEGYEGGYEDVKEITKQEFWLNVETDCSYFGPHSDCEKEGQKSIDAILIKRES